jgi:3-oxoacyl-[acyl-carrier-protein] synthase II
LTKEMPKGKNYVTEERNVTGLGNGRRVVITGLGPVTPVGIGKESYWKSLAEGRSAFRRIEFPSRDMSQYRCQIAAPIEGFNFYDHVERTKYAKYFGRTSQFSVLGAQLALKDAGITLEKKEREDSSEGKGLYELKGVDASQAGVILGIGAEAMELLEHYHERFLSRGMRGLSPFALPNIYMSSITSHVTEFFTLRGPSLTVTTACASASHAIISGFIQIRDGIADLMVTGGADACLTPYVFAGFDIIRAMSTRNDLPQKACRPFDRERDGFVMGEGSGILVLEELEHAMRREAPNIYGEVVGYGMTADAFHITEPDPEGRWLAKAMRDALRMGGVPPEEIDYINPHGTSTPLNDKVETKAIKDVFGKHAFQIPVSATKSITGHLMGAAGGVEVIAIALALRKGVIHPTLNYENPDPDCDLDYVPNESREKEVRSALSLSAGFGGVNSVILVKKFEESLSV